MTRKTYTTQVRVLLCQQCGAPLETAEQGGAVACGYCRVENQVSRRRDALPFAPPSMPIDENERQRRLRSQDGRPLVPPPSLVPLLSGNGIHPAKLDEAFHVYQATRREVQATHSPEAAERLYFLTLIVNNHFGTTGDDARRRAVLETSLDTLDMPRHVQCLRSLLASASIKEGDLASAEQWLAPLNPRSDDIDSDSAFRVARAYVDTYRGDFHAVINLLGHLDDGYPIADTWDPTAAVLRANALERLGDVQAAVTALRSRMGKESQGGRATMEAIVRAHAQLQLCAQSFPIAMQGHAQHAAQHAASRTGGGIGSIFYFVGIGIMGFGVLLAVGLSVPMMLGGLFGGGGGMEGGLIGMGSGLFSGFMALVTTVPLGLIFAVIGHRFREKAKRAAWLRVNGIACQGRIRGVSPTGVSINDVPVVRVEVEVLHPSVAPYVASFEQLYGSDIASVMQPGGTVPIRVHPQQPTEIILESA
ncbi:MAG: hypothetical protein AB7S26_16305 [Sandaracinaceae bacterium]